MMTFLTVLLTIVLILDCVLLCLLVLVQLPKKEAGLGMAFGGGAADALFGAGSGTALSQITKWSTVIFFVLVFLLSVLNNYSQRNHESALKGALERVPAATAPPAAAPAPAKPAQNTPAIPLTISTNNVTPTPAPATPVKTNK